jgi:hypothetical protein
VSIFDKRFLLPVCCGALLTVAGQTSPCGAQEAEKEAPRPAANRAPGAAGQEQPPKAPAAASLPSPDPVPEEKLAPTLETVPVRRDRQTYNYQMINTALLPRDKNGIWVLDFSFKPLRLRTVEVPGKGRRVIHYLYYKVVNRTGKPRMFVPQFIMVNEEGKKFEDEVVPQAIPVIKAREDATVPVRGAVDIIGEIPPSTKEGVDDAVFGVATWDRWDPKADRFSIYVRGLSDGYKEIPNASGGKPTVKYKTLRIDFIRRGDEHNLSEKEIELNDPPYEWVYW